MRAGGHVAKQLPKVQRRAGISWLPLRAAAASLRLYQQLGHAAGLPERVIGIQHVPAGAGKVQQDNPLVEAVHGPQQVGVLRLGAAHLLILQLQGLHGSDTAQGQAGTAGAR